MTVDVIIAGAGPAAILLAVELVERGLKVVIVAPRPTDPWPQNFGLWIDGPGTRRIDPPMATVWSATSIAVRPGEHRALGRAYGQLDGAALQRRTLAALQISGAVLRDGKVLRVVHRPRLTEVHTTVGILRTSVFVDATGHAARFVEREPAEVPLRFQTAFGVLATLDTEWPTPEQMTLMDFSDSAATGVPTFLYAMPFTDGRVFLEETVLLHGPAVPPDALEPRLHERLRGRGIRIQEIHKTERCVIPMNAPRPVLDQRAFAFGGSASMVHPCTGYSVDTAMATAPEVAATIAGGLKAGHDPARIVRAAWSCLWSPDRVEMDALFRFAANYAARLDLDQIRGFFDEFFALPVDEWSAFVDRTGDIDALHRSLRGMYGSAPRRMRRSLVVHALRPSQWRWLGRAGFPGRRVRERHDTTASNPSNPSNPSHASVKGRTQ